MTAEGSKTMRFLLMLSLLLSAPALADESDPIASFAGDGWELLSAGNHKMYFFNVASKQPLFAWLGIYDTQDTSRLLILVEVSCKNRQLANREAHEYPPGGEKKVGTYSDAKFTYPVPGSPGALLLRELCNKVSRNQGH